MSAEILDVLVVGAGHQGCATALGLARAGLRVEVVESVRSPEVPWTSVHHWSVLPGLARLGVLPDLLALGATVERWGLRVLATGEQLDFDLGHLAGPVEHAYHLRVEGADADRVFRAALDDSQVPIRSGRVLTVVQHPAGVSVEVEGDDGSHDLLRARWVVAADGATSAVRREVGIAFEGSTWPERCVVVTLRHDLAARGYPDSTWQVDPRRGAVVERIDDDRWRYTYQEATGLPEHEVGDRIPDVLRGALGVTPEVLSWTSERMHERVASRFLEGRVVLVGEAAHVTHRLLGHSSISGWFDAFSLAPVLADVVGGGSAEAVSRWAFERRRVYLDEAVAASLSRKNLLSDISDPRRLDIELEHYRRAQTDPTARREVLLAGCELEGLMPVLPDFRTPEPALRSIAIRS